MNKTYLICEKDNPSIVKIGASWDVEKRLASLESLTRRKLEIVSIIDMDIEYYAHKKFSALSIGGEWFSDDGSIRDFFSKSSKIDDLSSHNMNDVAGVDIDILSDVVIVDGMISVGKMISSLNKKRKRKFNLSQWIKTKRVQLKIKSLSDLSKKDQISIGRGRRGSTLVSKELFIYLASDLNISVDMSKIDMDLKKLSSFSPKFYEMIGRLYFGSSNKTGWNSDIASIVEDVRSLPESKVEVACADVCSLLLVMDNDEAVRLALEKNR